MSNENDKRDLGDALGDLVIPSMDEIEEERLRLTKEKEKRMITIMVIILAILVIIAAVLISLLMGVISFNDLFGMFGFRFRN